MKLIEQLQKATQQAVGESGLEYNYDPESQKYTQKMKKGGKVKAGGYVRSADGVAQRGKTKGRFV
jgi:hypothetical protein